MNHTKLKILHNVIDRITDMNEIKKTARVQNPQFYKCVNELIQDNYVEKTGHNLTYTVKTHLLKKISNTINIDVLLQNANELVFSQLSKPTTIEKLKRNTGLSTSTINRAISDLRSMGVLAISKHITDSGILQLSDKIDNLITLSKYLKIELEAKHDSDAEIIFRDNEKTLTKIQAGIIGKGQTTAFSLFSNYGIVYNTIHDYFIEQTTDVDLYDVLIHSIVAANHAKNKIELTMSIVFYTMNKHKFNVEKLRRIAKRYDVISIWLDIESYLRNEKLKNADIFLPWAEFVSKAELYNIPKPNYLLPTDYILFEKLGKKLKKKITVYIFGGENMRIKHLKSSTKDCDMVVENPQDLKLIKRILVQKLRYTDSDKIIIENKDESLYFDVLTRGGMSQLDLFPAKIFNSFVLSKNMMDSADFREYDNLRIGFLRNEYVFLLKAVAAREGDIIDMKSLVTESFKQPKEFQHGKFDWNIVWQELCNQIQSHNVDDTILTIFEQISILQDNTDIKIPILRKLRHHYIDFNIKLVLRGGKLSQLEIIDLLQSSDVTERMIRDRINALEKLDVLKKEKLNHNIIIYLNPIPQFFDLDKLLTLKNLEAYLNWRFHLRKPVKIVDFVNELNKFGYKTLGDVDRAVIQSLYIAQKYENEQYTKDHFNRMDMTRICLSLTNPKLKNISTYNISERSKYLKLL